MATMTHDSSVEDGGLRTSGLLVGLGLALVAAMSFGLSGSVAKGLIEAGWTPGAAVTARVWIGGLTLVIPAVIALRGRWDLVRANAGMIAGFGLMAVAVCQLAYFNAVQYMPVGMAMLIEYIAPVVVVLWVWLRRGSRPTRLTGVGAVVCIGGLAFVLDVFSGITLDPVGVMWALIAMAGAATFFIMSGSPRADLPPIVLAAGGLISGATGLTVAGLVGVLPMDWGTDAATYGGLTVPWWVAVLTLGVVSAAVPYATGIGAVRHLGSRLASFVALAEVVGTLVFGWVLLGEVPTGVQFIGGGLILGGVVLVKLGERD